MTTDLSTALELGNPIMEVAVELGVTMRGNIGECFCGDRHPEKASPFTLFFNPAQNSFFCKYCPDIGGGVVDLVCQFRRWNRRQARKWLQHRIDFDRETRSLYYERGKRAYDQQQKR